jgi:hypothetical protein
MNWISGLCYTFLLIGFSSWYIPYYNERLDQYNKHNFVLKEECLSGKLHPEIQHNEMTFDGLSTNCTRAKVFISIPIWLGALNNMWEGSVFYTLLHATNWQIQVAYVIFGLVIVVVVIMEISKHIKWSRVATFLKGKNSISVQDNQSGRRRIMTKGEPIDKDQIKKLAVGLMKNQPSPPKRNLLSEPSPLTLVSSEPSSAIA